MPVHIAAEISDFHAADYMPAKKAKHLDLATRYGVAAAKMAALDADLDVSKMDPDRAGVVEGISLSGTETTLKGQLAMARKNYRAINVFSLVTGYCGSGSGEIALELGCQGHAITHCSGSASGNDALGYAFNMIQQDEADVMVAGGAEAPLLPELWGVFCVTKVMTSRNDTPQTAMRPFDRNRDGFLLGEGAAFLILEELTHALSRGVRIYAEIAGHGRSCEAYHSVAPHPEGLGAVRALEKALRRARMEPQEVDYINLHGTATELNDVVETTAVKTVFGSHARKLALSSTKPVTGHLLGASGAIESVVCAMALQRQEIPPTINLSEPAEGCDLDYVPRQSRPYPLQIAANLNSGFGGKNSCLIFRKYRAGS